MKNLIWKILSDVDGMPSSKRFLMLWIGVVIWTFIHAALFFLVKPLNAELTGTVILYDMILICLLGGLNVSEKIWGGKDQEPKV